MAPILARVEEAYPEIELQKINADDPANEDLMREHDVRSIPTIVITFDCKPVEVITGFQSFESLSESIDRQLETVRQHNRGVEGR